MANFSIHARNQDTDLKARSLELTIDGKSVYTPHRAFYFQPNNDYSEARIINKKTLRGINEIYLHKEFEEIESMRKDISKQTKLIAGFQNAVNRSGVGTKEILLTFLHYDARKQHQRSEFLDRDYKKKKRERTKNPAYVKSRMPSKDETDYLVRLYASLPSDVLIPPIIQGADGVSYLEFLDSFFEIVNSTSRLKSKTIMGLIPKVADLELPGLLDFYNDKNVRLYAMDFVGGQPLHFAPHLIKISQFFEKLERDYDEQCYLHGLNVRYGRMMEKLIVPARDVLSFSVGLDSFGVSHLGGGGTEEKFEGTAEQKRLLQLKTGLKKTALFSRGDYGYHRYHGNPAIRLKFAKDDKDVLFNLDSIDGATTLPELRNRVRIFNAERHAIEAHGLTEEILGRKSLRDYLEKKEAVDLKTMKEISKINNSVRTG